MKIYAGAFYIYKYMLLHALKSGTPTEVDPEFFSTVLDNYVFGNPILNITNNLRLDSLFYDAYTHNYLGRYLRFYRDYTGVDLMPLYNCFAETAATTLNVQDNTGTSLMKSDSEHVIYIVDVAPYHSYTIYLDCPFDVELIAGYYANGALFDLSSLKTEGIAFPYRDTYMKRAGCTFNHPFVYDKLSAEAMSGNAWNLGDEDMAMLYRQRDNMKLFIKVPSTSTSALVVLEGDYVENSQYHFNGRDLRLMDQIIGRPYVLGDDGEYEAIPNYKFDQSFDRKYLTTLQLGYMNSNINHPFSDRLIEYLVNNAITPMDNLDSNIARVQENLAKRKAGTVRLEKIGLKGVWSDSMRNVLYGLARTQDVILAQKDILGYVDKDLEALIQLKDGE